MCPTMINSIPAGNNARLLMQSLPCILGSLFGWSWFMCIVTTSNGLGNAGFVNGSKSVMYNLDVF